MDLFATIPDLEARLGRNIVPSEMGRAVAMLEDASALAREIVGYEIWTVLDTDGVSTGEIDPAKIPGSARAVVLRAAERAMRNPGGFSSESSGDYSYQRTGTQQPGVFLTEGEERTLRRAAGRTGLWTQPVTRGDLGYDTVFLEDSFGCELFPYDVVRYEDS